MTYLITAEVKDRLFFLHEVQTEEEAILLIKKIFNTKNEESDSYYETLVVFTKDKKDNNVNVSFERNDFTRYGIGYLSTGFKVLHREYKLWASGQVVEYKVVDVQA